MVGREVQDPCGRASRLNAASEWILCSRALLGQDEPETRELECSVEAARLAVLFNQGVYQSHGQLGHVLTLQARRDGPGVIEAAQEATTELRLALQLAALQGGDPEWRSRLVQSLRSVQPLVLPVCSEPGVSFELDDINLDDHRSSLPVPQALGVSPGEVTVRFRSPALGVSIVRVTAQYRETVEARCAFPPVPPPQRDASLNSPLRVASYSLLTLGAISTVTSAILWGQTALQQRDSRDSTLTSPEPYAAWARFQAEVNPSGALTSSEVCELSLGSPSREASTVQDLCSTNSAYRVSAIVFTVVGVLSAVVGSITLLNASDAPRRSGRAQLRWLGAGLDLQF